MTAEHGSSFALEGLSGVLAALCCLVLLAAPLRAQELAGGRGYITPFPENDLYRLQVYGDTLAEGLLGGMLETFVSDARLQIQRQHYKLGGLFRNEFEDDLRTIESNMARAPVHIAVVMLGVYDRIGWRPPRGGRRLPVGSDEWKAEYSARVDRLMRLFKAKGTALYWIGLPMLRRGEASDEAQIINEVVRERAYVNGQKYVDVYSQFAGENGAYSAYGPDLEGKNRLLREADGIHFTQAGYRKLAHFVERDVRRDLTQARSERTIPLAGSDAEQKRIRALRPAATAGAPAGKGAKDGKSVTTGRDPAAATPRQALADGGGPGDVKADNSRITLKSIGNGGKEESVAIDIVRPAIPASVVALVTRRESADRASQVGDSMTAEIGGGLTVVSSVTLSAVGMAGDQRRLPPTQTPYYRVLIKGDRLAPKPGRADDFSWPKPDPPSVDAISDALSKPPTSVKLAPARARRPVMSPNG